MKANFQADLAYSHSLAAWPGWFALYQQAFPSLQQIVDHHEDGEHQRAGIDRSLILANSKQILVDEKVRRKDYRDGCILLEVWSDEERRIPGWVHKPLRADYIAYLIAPAGRGYLLPVPQLQLAWARHGEAWSKPAAAWRRSPNPGYTTASVLVHERVLYPAIGAALRLSFAPFEAP